MDEKIIEMINEGDSKDLRLIVKALARIKDEIERDLYIGKIAKKFKISRRAIQKDIKKYSLPSQMKSKTSLSSLTSLTPPTGLIELVRTEDGLKYCLPDFSLKDSLEVSGMSYRPPRNTTLINLPTIDFLKIGVGDDDEILFDDVRDFIYDHVDLAEDFGYEILTLWVFHTWLIDRFNVSPILHFLGPYASGKSRAGDTLGALAKRGLCTVNLTGASIFRVSEVYQPTFIIDEVKLTGRDRDRDILELLNARFQRGRKVIRINPDKSGLDSIQEFDVFGATVICGLDELPETPRSRATVFVMEQNTRPVLETINPNRAGILRDRLCGFRARHISEEIPKAKRFVRDGRLGDAIEPLYQILNIVKPEKETDFINFFRKVENKKREETYDSFDAEVVQALLKCRSKVRNGKIEVGDVTTAFNEGKSESEQLGGKTIGRVLTRLKLEKTRVAGGKTARFWNEERIERLCKKYGLGEDVSGVNEVSDEKNLKSEEKEKIFTHQPLVREDPADDFSLLRGVI
jgi:hypothetical protein